MLHEVNGGDIGSVGDWIQSMKDVLDRDLLEVFEELHEDNVRDLHYVIGKRV